MAPSAIIGRTFWDGALRKICGIDLEIEPQLTRLVSRDLIYRKDVSTFIGQNEYSFKHALLRDVTYETVLSWDRMAHHGQAAKWIAEMTRETGRQEEYTVVIAEHHELSGQAELAADWYLRAGRLASNRGAPAEAKVMFDKSLDLLPERSRL